MEFEPSQLVSLVRRWWWLMVVGALVGGMVGYVSSARKEPVYSARVMVQINAPLSGDGFNSDMVQVSESLAMTYQQLLSTRDVLDPVVQSLSLPYGVEDLRENVSGWTIRGTQLIEIRVTDSSAQRAADVANAVASSFAEQIANRTIDLGQPVRAEIDDQLSANSQQIDQINQQIQGLAQGAEADDPATTSQLEQLNETVSGLQQAQAELQARKQTMDLDAAAAKKQVTIASAAEPASSPDAPQPRLATVFGIAFGTFVAAAVMVVIGYRDDRVNDETNVAELAGVPSIGRIMHRPRIGWSPDPLFMLDQPDSEASEAIRTLRTNILFASSENRIGSLMVSSPGKGEGKSTLVANLAISLAQSGLRIILIDADLREPSLHRLFGLSNTLGLSSWLTRPRRNGCDYIQETYVRNLRVITSGPSHSRPADLLSLGRLRRLIDAIRDQADIVLVDSPPALAYTDAVLVAADVDGVVLVCRAHRTRRDELRKSVSLLRQSPARIVGIVLNHQSRRAHGSVDVSPDNVVDVPAGATPSVRPPSLAS